MATLEEIIKQRLAEATEQSKESLTEEKLDEASIDEDVKDKQSLVKIMKDSGFGDPILNAKKISNDHYAFHFFDDHTGKHAIGHFKRYSDGTWDHGTSMRTFKSKDTATDALDKLKQKKNSGISIMANQLTKESLDEMSEEEIQAIDEEQLDELSKATLGNYIKAAGSNRANIRVDVEKLRAKQKAVRDLKHGSDAEDIDALSKIGKKIGDKEDKLSGKSFNRTMGISTAVKKLTEAETVSSQVASLLEAEGLSDEFKLQAVTIFEAAVTDRVLQLEEGLQEEFESNLAEAKQEMNTNIDGFLSEAIQQWKQDNEVAIKSNFKSQLAESFMDGLMSLLQEHSIDLPAEKEDALTVALSEVDKLNEEAESKQTEIEALTEQLNTLKAEKLLESYKEKMTVTEFDRFVQLTESIKFTDEAQYEKQLNIVQENFGSKSLAKKAEVVINEEITPVVPEKIVTESTSNMDLYVKHLTAKL